MQRQHLLKFRELLFLDHERSSRHYVKNDEGINFCQRADVKIRTDWDIFSRIRFEIGKLCMSAKWHSEVKFEIACYL